MFQKLKWMKTSGRIWSYLIFGITCGGDILNYYMRFFFLIDKQILKYGHMILITSIIEPSSFIRSKRIENVESIALKDKRKSSIISRAAYTSTFYNDADLISSINIFTANRELVQFKDLWDQSNGMDVVALLRHFGCPCCWSGNFLLCIMYEY